MKPILILGSFMVACGFVWLLVLAGWQVALAILIILIGNNIEQHERSKRK